MSLSLGDFHTLVSGEVNKGSRLDSVIPTFTRRAARFIERNYNFLYMERFAELDLDVSVENPRFLAFPSVITKKINFVRYAQSFSGTNQQRYKYLTNVDPITINTVEPESTPSAYWQTGDNSGANFLVLDQVGTENITFDCHFVEYSEWSSNLSSTHWLLDNAEDLMVAQTMTMMAPYAREPDWLDLYRSMREEALRTLLMVDEEARAAGPAAGYKMVYSP